jgi:pimeloyl-ACP methyl ester carboxylesterase
MKFKIPKKKKRSRNMRILFISIKILIVIIIFLAMFFTLAFFQYFRPSKVTSNINPSQFNLEYESISFTTNDGLTLRGWFVPSNYSDAVIIVGHGYPFDKANIFPATRFLNQHYNLLYYDYRYFGESGGWMTTFAYKETQDLLQAVKFTRKKGFDKIGIYGFSMSANNALLLKSQDIESENIKAIVADSAFANFYEFFENVFWIFPGATKKPVTFLASIFTRVCFGMNVKKISPENNVKTLQVPILIIHGSEDSMIPVEHAHRIHKNAPNSELWIIQNADHSQTLSNKREYQERVLGFFDKHLLESE